jgi:tropomyosin
MNSLRLEADEATSKVEELQSKVKALEQENLSKEQEITSLQHKNGLLESEVEKHETSIKDFKKAADEVQQHGTQNETLQRRLQLLEEEAEEADKTLRETNEKYAIKPPSADTPIPSDCPCFLHLFHTISRLNAANVPIT